MIGMVLGFCYPIGCSYLQVSSDGVKYLTFEYEYRKIFDSVLILSYLFYSSDHE